MSNACSELFYTDKDPSDATMCDFIQDHLEKVHPEEISTVKNAAGGWKRFWNDAIFSLVSRLIYNKICYLIDKIVILTHQYFRHVVKFA